MSTRSSHRPFLALLFVLLPLFAPAEKKKDFDRPPYGKALLKPIEKSGTYRLPIEPDLQKHCMLDLRDLRLYGGGKEIPYLLEKPAPFDPLQKLRTLDILNKKTLRKGGNLIKVKNPSKDSIRTLALEVDQGKVSRSIHITASNDKKKWVEVHSAQRYHDEELKDGTRGFVLRKVELPPYRYYRIHIGAEGRGTDPRILEARIVRINKGWNGYEKIAVHDLKVLKKKGRTYIQPIYDAPSYRINGFELRIADSDLFYRKGFIAKGDPRNSEPLKRIGSFDLVSYGNLEIRFKGATSKGLWIVIKDRDLPALSIKGVNAYQRRHSLLFRAKDTGRYFLRFGDRQAVPPGYELPHFKEKMTQKPLSATIDTILWDGPPLGEWIKGEKKKEDSGLYRTFTIIGIILIWVFGVIVLLAIGVVIYRRLL